jgi:hypothetical protein
LVLGVPLSASAATLYSAPIAVGGGFQFRCSVVNVSKRSTRVTVNIYDGSTVASSTLAQTSDEVELQPRELAVQGLTNGGGGKDYFCEFIVAGGRKKVRAMGCRYLLTANDNLGCLSSLPAE